MIGKLNKEMIIVQIQKDLFELQDTEYKNFQGKLIPTVQDESIIGVRTPELKKYAREMINKMPEEDLEIFMGNLPHKYFEENQLQAFVISETKDFDKCIEKINAFLPYVDNWATCDQMCPKVFGKNHHKLKESIMVWLNSGDTYAVRFAIKMMMDHFLLDDFDLIYPEMVAGIRSEEYYINMMKAWYFATALAKRYDDILPFIENHSLDEWSHNKAIQKAIESYRVSREHKEYLRTLKIKNKKVIN